MKLLMSTQFKKDLKRYQNKPRKIAALKVVFEESFWNRYNSWFLLSPSITWRFQGIYGMSCRRWHAIVMVWCGQANNKACPFRFTFWNILRFTLCPSRPARPSPCGIFVSPHCGRVFTLCKTAYAIRSKLHNKLILNFQTLRIILIFISYVYFTWLPFQPRLNY